MNLPRAATQLPPQLSEATFRVYEPFIHAAVKAWPDETRWAPEELINTRTQRPLSPATFAGRMRDAIVSFRNNAWESYIDAEKFREIFGAFSVAMSADGSVWFRNRGRKGRPLTFAKEAGPTNSAPASVGEMWGTATDAEISAACVLLHHTRISGPIIINGTVSQELTDHLTSNYNVAIHFDSSSQRTIIT